VAVAVIVRQVAGQWQVLFAQRPEGKVYAGYWEFPGGKLETGESVRAALVREIQEELGIEVTASRPWITQTFSYAHAHVHLAFEICNAWLGAIPERGLESQATSWQVLSENPIQSIALTPLLPALLANEQAVLRNLWRHLNNPAQ
jgi:8-oxo-dGTP diphosphatase